MVCCTGAPKTKETVEAPVEAPAPVVEETKATEPVAAPKPECVVMCVPVDEVPTKVMGAEGDPQAKVWLNKLDGGRQTMRIEIEPGFDWLKSVSPHLPNCPAWCPATHFGVLESGKMQIKMEDGSEFTINAGDTYFVPPNHLPVVEEKTVMIEFTQDTTYLLIRATSSFLCVVHLFATAHYHDFRDPASNSDSV
ncbi:unnamed protein product [Amoebophrya sp. A120]|nr:unnamed protein product [Amoebophrya sp. A120]|eukprot:GSA120T00005796001.1